MSIEDEQHEQHQQANKDHAAWLRDISRWRVDHRKALALLRQVEATILELDGEMEAHASAIRDHHLHITHHERELAAHGANKSSDDLHEMYAGAHRESMATHADVASHHDSIAVQHSELMNNIASLFEALADD